jgi:hypothetical protein
MRGWIGGRLVEFVLGVVLAIGVGGGFVVGEESGRGEVAGQVMPVEPSATLAGDWRGMWLSGTTGHRGPMRAEFRSAGPGSWEVVFRGRFCALIPFRYSAVLCESRGEDGSVQLRGSRNLGPLFGTFHFSGTVREGRLNARWWSKKESGRFVLER